MCLDSVQQFLDVDSRQNGPKRPRIDLFNESETEWSDFSEDTSSDLSETDPEFQPEESLNSD